MNKKKKNEVTIHSSAAGYLTSAAATGDDEKSIEMRLRMFHAGYIRFPAAVLPITSLK